VLGLALLWPLILLGLVTAACDTGSSGLFRQQRIGRWGRPFILYKLRTMSPGGEGDTITLKGDSRITRCGAVLRRWKLDELPQLWNVLRGDMSFVGPRPDVAGFLDRLEGEDRALLALRPGITGPATLKYRDEEALLASVGDPVYHNRHVIWPDKVRINLRYMESWSLLRDIGYIIETVRR